MKRLRQEREAQGLTRAQLGAKAEIHPASVGQFESGRVIPYPIQLQRLAVALDWLADPAALMDEVEA